MSPSSRPRFAVSLLLFACLVGAVAGSACIPNERKDAHCSPADPSYATNPDCIYAGKGKGPVFPQTPCPPLTGTKPASCANAFNDLVDMMSDSARGNCTAEACHGDPANAEVGIVFDDGDLPGFYAELTTVTGSVGTPYVVADDPSTPANEALNSWMQCNVVAQSGGGFPMPTWSGLSNAADVQVVTDWLLCGAPGPTQ